MRYVTVVYVEVCLLGVCEVVRFVVLRYVGFECMRYAMVLYVEVCLL